MIDRDGGRARLPLPARVTLVTAPGLSTPRQAWLTRSTCSAHAFEPRHLGLWSARLLPSASLRFREEKRGPPIAALLPGTRALSSRPQDADESGRRGPPPCTGPSSSPFLDHLSERGRAMVFSSNRLAGARSSHFAVFGAACDVCSPSTSTAQPRNVHLRAWPPSGRSRPGRSRGG